MKNKIIALIVATLVGICLAAYFAMKPMDTKLANDNIFPLSTYQNPS